MELKDLQQKALEIADKYSELNQSQERPNWSAAEYMQAFVGDVGDLAKLVMAKNNFRTIDNHDQKIAHELSDCLWAILVLARKLDIDLESAFTETMLTIEQKIKSQMK